MHGSITSGHATVFLAGESSSQVDYNGDGDRLDQVLHVRDGVLGKTTNLGIAASIMQFDGRFIAFLASEYGQGGSDLNGDGDAVDNVLHVHDGRRGTTTNMKLATYTPKVDQGYVAFAVFETQQGGTDLNGDGDTIDTVMHVHAAASGKTYNTKMAGLRVSGIDGRDVLFSASEYSQGQDLNGDGDTNDSIVHVFNAATTKLSNLGVVSFYSSAIEGGVAAIPVSEGGEGRDLNGDGDKWDNVLSIYDTASGTMRNLGLATLGTIEIEQRRVAFTVYEYAQGYSDLNGDGDGTDAVVHIHDMGTAKTTAIAAATLVAMIGPKVCMAVSEYKEAGVDLNGDGDAFDRVLAVHDAASGKTINHGLATSALQAGTTRILVEGSEWHQGGTDLNGDGDTYDYILYVIE